MAALSSALQLPQHPRAHETMGLHLFLAFYPDNDMPFCLTSERILRTDLDLARCEGNVRSRFARARRTAEEQYRALHPDTCYGAGLVILSIRHDGARDYETTFPLYLEITRADAAIQMHVPYWPLLLGTYLHFGRPLDPRNDQRYIRCLRMIHSGDASVGTLAAHNWDSDWEPTDGHSCACADYLTTTEPDFLTHYS